MNELFKDPQDTLVLLCECEAIPPQIVCIYTESMAPIGIFDKHCVEHNQKVVSLKLGSLVDKIHQVITDRSGTVGPSSDDQESVCISYMRPPTVRLYIHLANKQRHWNPIVLRQFQRHFLMK